MISPKELCKKAEDFASKDIKVIDDYLDKKSNIFSTKKIWTVTIFSKGSV